jgi:beta-phosphoglucomutase-like phosphatase (HAD superfamily)
MVIEFKSRPGHVATFIKTHGLTCVGWDLDGTLANTEHLHRTICRAALQEISGTLIGQREFGEPHYRGAFGLPAAETSARLAISLRDVNPEGFTRARGYAEARGMTGDPVEVVGKALSFLRDEIFAFYIRNVQVETTPGHGGVLSLKLSCPPTMTDPQLVARRDALQGVKVHTYPYIVEALEVFDTYGLAQGVCTSSGKAFALPLLSAFGIDRKFSAVVTADCVPDGSHKPEPDPWYLLHARLSNASHPREKPITDMMFIENSSSGSFSSIRAGSGPTFVIADNIPATTAKLEAKMKAFRKQSPDVVIPGRATFIPDLGKLVAPSREHSGC